LTTAQQCIKTLEPYTLSGFEPWTFFSGGGRDNHYTDIPQWQCEQNYLITRFTVSDFSPILFSGAENLQNNSILSTLGLISNSNRKTSLSMEKKK
jgi:hypothetical protein